MKFVSRKKYTKSTYRKKRPVYTKRYTTRRRYFKRKTYGLRKYKKGQKIPQQALRYFKVALKGSVIEEMSQASQFVPNNQYGYQFRRFGCGGASASGTKTVGVNQTQGWLDMFKMFREVAFTGLSVRMVPLNYRQNVSAQAQREVGAGGTVGVNSVTSYNNTWYDTDIGYNSSLQYIPGTTVTLPDQYRRPTLQRHAPQAGWKKFVTNRPYARKQKLNWFATSTFHTGSNPTNPAGIPSAVLRHYFELDEGSLNWPAKTPLYKYEFTYYLTFRGLTQLVNPETVEYGPDVDAPVEVAAEVAEDPDQQVPDEELISIPGSESPEYAEFVKKFKATQIKS